MKKFSLNTKRAGKVLALALVAALVVPSVPGQAASSAGTVSGNSATADVEVPKTIGTVAFSEKSDVIGADGTTGKALHFTDAEATTQEFIQYDEKGNETGKISLKEKVVATTGDGVYVWDDIDVTPEIANLTEDYSTRGAVAVLKNKTVLENYPKGVNSYSYIQKEKNYYSSLQIENPFVAYRSTLFDSKRYSLTGGPSTSMEVESEVVETWNEENTPSASQITDRNRYSRPDAKTGVTISFWAKVPLDDEEQVPETTFFEFANKESLIYKTDDLAKRYVAVMWDEATKDGTTAAQLATKKESPFYIGDVVEGTIAKIGTNSNVKDYLKKMSSISGDAIEGETKLNYVINGGYLMKWNPELAKQTKAVIADGDAYRVWSVATVNTDSAATGNKNKEITVDSGRKTNSGETIYYHLWWSDKVYSDINDNPNYTNFRPTGKAPFEGAEDVGATQITTGATGYVYTGTKQTMYFADDNSKEWKTGTNINPLCTNQGVQNGQANTNAYVEYKNPLAERIDDEEWHYYTLTLTDEWFQVYVDGVAIDPSKTSTWYGNTFNLGGGLYKPAIGESKAGIAKSGYYRSDYEKLCNDDWSGSIIGSFFGVSVMDFITDPNTKLYIGSRTHMTVEGTLVDSLAFYDKAFSPEVAKAEYEARKDVADPEIKDTPIVGGILGDVNKDDKVSSEDASIVLKYDVGLITDEEQLALIEAVGDVNNDKKVSSEDASLILKYDVGLVDEEFKPKK